MLNSISCSLPLMVELLNAHEWGHPVRYSQNFSSAVDALAKHAWIGQRALLSATSFTPLESFVHSHKIVPLRGMA